jgi:predicted permease
MRPDDPPRLPLALLRALLSRAERDEILADVVEEYLARVACEGRAAARRWLWRQALGSAPALVRWSWWREWSGFEPRANAYNAGGPMVRNWIADARYSARRLRSRPGYTLLAVLTLALGVGGTAAVSGIVRFLLFDPLPYAHEREVGVFWKKTDWSEEEFLYVRGRVPGFSQVALYRLRDVMLREGDAPARLLAGLSASSELFDVLGARPMIGRGFRAGDDVAGTEPFAVLSFGLWQEMGGDPSVVGTRLTLDGRPRTVIGVMPRGFWFPDPSVRVWTTEQLSTSGRTYNSTLVGRVEAGRDVHEMSVPVVRLTAMLDERFDYPAQWDKTRDAHITPMRDELMGGMRLSLLATLGAMALILLIACANVAALMLGQVDARSSELAVRLALGASRRRLTRQLVVEAMLIAFGAGTLGAGLAWGGFRVLAHALPLGAWTETTAPDWTVFASAIGIAVTAALLVVVVPTVSLRRDDLRNALGSARTGGLQGRGGRLENGLVVAEVALAMLIASGAALLARSVANLYAVDAGVRAEGVAVLDVMMGGGLSLERQRAAVGQLIAALAGLPGVQVAGAAQTLPLRGGGYNVAFSIEGRSDLEGSTTEYRIVTPGYLEAMGFELMSGRTITGSDRSDTERVVVINEALSEKYFGGVDPIGQRVGGDAEFARVIGVVANAAERRLIDDPVPVRYVAVAQMPWVDVAQSLVLHAAPGADPVPLLDEARRTLERVAPGVAVREATTLSRVLDKAVGPARQVVSLLSLLTALALTLGAVGVYGVIAHFAARRRRDWAIRIALGLPGSRAVAHVVGHGALLMAAGIAIGVVAAAGLARLLSSLLYGVGAIDAIAFVAAAATLLAVGLLAAFVPALRAGMTDPATVLREP